MQIAAIAVLILTYFRKDEKHEVLLLNGSPRKEGCTFTALSEVAKTLNHNGIDTEIFQAGNPDTDNVKAAAAKLKEADALIVGSPVYWASPSGQIIEFMDKLCSMAGKDMLHKPAAAVASARRAGTTATLDVFRNISAIMKCLLYLLTTGTWFTEILLQKLHRMKKDFRSCAHLETIWHGF